MRLLKRRSVRTTAVSTIVVGGLVAGALIGSSTSSPAMALAPIGHWVFNGGQATALHVDPGTGRVDAAVAVPEARDASMVVQGPEAAYVVSPTKVTVFGKSTLSVDSSHELTDVAGLPTPIETVGGPYLVYRTSGVVVRLGVPPASIQSGGALTRPTYTDEGVVWIERADTGDVCSIAAQQDSTSCASKVDPSRPHALTVVDGTAGVVDLAAGMFTPISGGSARSIGMPLPLDAKVADRTTSDGMLPVVLPSGTPELLLLPVGANAARGVTKTPLPPGSYDEPLATDTSATVVDSRSGTLRSFGSDGARRGEQASPAAVGGLLHRGADGDAYLDGQGGSKAFIVRASTGEISAVDTTVAAAKDAVGAAPDPSVVALGAPGRSTTGPPVGPPRAGSSSNAEGAGGNGADGGRADSGGPDPVEPPGEKVGVPDASGGGGAEKKEVEPPEFGAVTTVEVKNAGFGEGGGGGSGSLEWDGPLDGTYAVTKDGKTETVRGTSTVISLPDRCGPYRITVVAKEKATGSAATTFGEPDLCKPRPRTPSAVQKDSRGFLVSAYTPTELSETKVSCQVLMNGQSGWSGDCSMLPSGVPISPPDYSTTYKITIRATNKYGSTTGPSTTIRTSPDLTKPEAAEGQPADGTDQAGATTTTTTTTKKPTPKTTRNNGG